jgi:hypothetical protein
VSLTADQIMTLNGQHLPFSRDLREALAIYARRMWPLNTSVHAAKAWGVSKSTATNVLKGHASDATVTRIIRAGGWELALPVIGAVIGHPVHSFFRDQMQKAAKEAERAEHHDRLASAAYRRLEGSPADHGEGGAVGSKAGSVGSKAPRRVA